MKKILLLIAVLFTTGPFLNAETRGIYVWITRSGPEKKIVVNINSDEKDENKRNISLGEAGNILKHAKNWGSTVMVSIMSDTYIETSSLLPLIQAISENPYLKMTYLLNSGYPDSKEEFLERFR